MADLVNVTFDKSDRVYKAGEQAGFAPDIAQRYVDAGVAHPTAKKDAAQLRPEPPKDKPVTPEQQAEQSEKEEAEKDKAEPEKEQGDKPEPEADKKKKK